MISYSGIMLRKRAAPGHPVAPDHIDMQKAAEQRSFFEAQGRMPARRQYAANLLRRFRSVHPAGPNLAILDLGCGTGALAAAFNELGCQCVGLEPEQSAWQVAGALAGRTRIPARIVGGEAEALPFREESFDAVIANSVLEHVADPERVAAEVYRILKPGGIFWFETASAMCPFQREIERFPLFGWYPDWLKRRIMHWAHVHRPHWIGGTHKPALHWFTDTRAAGLLLRNGFQRVYDRWDIRCEDEGAAWHAYVLRTIRSCRPLRRLANICIPDCSYVGVKASC